jgi:Tfp pilus assembly protein PilO
MNLRSVAVTRLLGIAFLVLLTLAAWLLLLGPTLSELGAVDERKTDVQDGNALMSVQLAQLEAQAEGLPKTNARAAQLAEVFPPTADQPGFFAQVTEAASRAGIGADEITDISHGAPVVPGEEGAADGGSSSALPTTPADATIALQPVTVTVTASYADLTALLGNLESMRRTLMVTGLDLSTQTAEDGPAGAMTLTVSGVTFVAPPLDAPDADSPAGRVAGGGGDTQQASG